MKIISRFWILKCKSCAKAFIKSAAGIVLVFLFLAAGIAGVSFGMLQGQVLPKIKVAMVVPDNEGITNMAVQFVSAFDSVKSICEFCYMEEQEAIEELKADNLQVVIILPVNFYQDVYLGYNTPVQILMKRQDEISSEVFEGLLTSGISYLQTSESGVYAVLDIAKNETVQLKGVHVGDFIAEYYIRVLFDRMNLYDEKIISPLGTIDYSQYILVMFLFLMLLLMGSNFSVLYQENEKIVERKLRGEGINSIVLTLTKVSVMTVYMWGLWIFVYGGICLVSDICRINIIWWDSKTVLGIGIVCISMAAFFHFVYEIVGNAAMGSVFLLFVNAGMALCSGIVIPSSYLNNTVNIIGRFFPVTLWNDYIQICLFDRITIEQATGIILFTCIEIFIGALITWKNT